MQKEIKNKSYWNYFKKNSLLYKSSNICFLLPSIIEAGPGNYIPTSSTTTQICLGDATISTINQRKFSKLDFKNFIQVEV